MLLRAPPSNLPPTSSKLYSFKLASEKRTCSTGIAEVPFLWQGKERGTATSTAGNICTFVYLSDSNPSRLLSCRSLTGCLQLMLRTALPCPVDFLFPGLSHFTLTTAPTPASLPAPTRKNKLLF